ncbi:MAG: ATP-binding protein [Pyrobaculum sp.]
MTRGEALEIHEIEKIGMGVELNMAASRMANGGNVYIVGPPGSGKTAFLRRLGLHLWRAGAEPLYIKLEWVKYGWGLVDYVKKYGEKSRELIGSAGSSPVLLDDGEFLWSYGKAYRNLIEDLRGKPVAAAFREVDLEALRGLLGEGLVLYLQRQGAGPPVLKIPLGLNFLGQSTEVVVI